MARYKIYDNSSDVITPVGEVLTAEQWLDRYPWGRFAKMIVGGGVIGMEMAAVYANLGTAASSTAAWPSSSTRPWSAAAGQAVTSAAAPPTRTTSPPWRPLRTLRLRTPASPTRPALRTRWKTWWP